MSDFIIQNELTIRLCFFFGFLLFMAVWEVLAPRRALLISKRMRWTGNLSLVLLNTLLLRLFFPAAAVGLAVFVNTNGWGLLNYYEIASVWAFIFSLLFLDMVIYLQHVMFHALPVLWRLHRVHHADLDFDLTTGLRFHPFEIILSMLIKFAAIIVLGPSVLAVLVFEVMLNALAMFNHGNVRLTLGIDRILRLFIVTPDMHRVHHSIEDHEANSNFGFNLSLWDRLFGTYIAQPDKGHESMLIGIHHYNNPAQLGKIRGMLLLPFKGKLQGYVINRREWKQSDKQDNS
jgi:sterol desaturase/sphingolipid hydroxylase (fatty acid hydroxylase superfamily)